MIRRFDRFYEKHPSISAALMFVALGIAMIAKASLGTIDESTLGVHPTPTIAFWQSVV